MKEISKRHLDSVPKKGTIAPIMSSSSVNNILTLTLFGKTRLAVLSLIYGNADEAFYLRQIERLTGAGMGAVQRELKTLLQAGIVTRSEKGKQVYYQANRQCPVFAELKSLIMKTAGVGDILRMALAPLAARIQVAFIYGSLARGDESRDSDVDLMVIGDVNFADVVEALSFPQQTLNREINPTIYPSNEFKDKLTAGHHFIKTVLEGDKWFLIGDEHDLARLASKRVVEAAQDDAAGN